MNDEEIREIANKLSTNDLQRLVELTKERFFVFVNIKGRSECFDLHKEYPFVINGTQIQINLEEDRED